MMIMTGSVYFGPQPISLRLVLFNFFLCIFMHFLEFLDINAHLIKFYKFSEFFRNFRIFSKFQNFGIFCHFCIKCALDEFSEINVHFRITKHSKVYVLTPRLNYIMDSRLKCFRNHFV
jgi:hypothetical protein